MSRGPGHVQRAILALIESDTDGAWPIGQICENVYGAGRVDKRHRVAVLRANRKLPGTWNMRLIHKSGGELCLCDPCSLASMSKKAWHERAWLNRYVPYDDYVRRWLRLEPGGQIYDQVMAAREWRDADELGRIDIEIRRSQTMLGLVVMGGNAAAARKCGDAIEALQASRDKLSVSIGAR